MSKLSKKISIGKQVITETSPVFIIAEAGVNHNGKLSLAKRLVDAAKKAGAQAVKFQTFTTAELVTKTAAAAPYQKKNLGNATTQADLLRKLELSKQDFITLKKYCDQKQIIFLSTPHTVSAVADLKTIVPAFKVGSGDLTNHYLLKQVAKTNKPILLSTGMSTLGEVKAAVAVMQKQGNDKIIILHCTSNYPCPPTEVNLEMMVGLKKALGALIGFSDHTQGVQAGVMAVLLGARVIEKHLTLDKKMTGPDHTASSDPVEFAAFVSAIRDIPTLLGTGVKKPSHSEQATLRIVRKSVVSVRPIAKGERLTLENITIKRPGTGIPAKKFESILGKKARRDIPADVLLKPTDYV